MQEDNYNNTNGDIPTLSVLAARKAFFRRKKTCPLSGPEAPVIDYKDIRLLSRFTSERGRILSPRITAVCAKKQRYLSQAIKRSRIIGLLPFVLK